MNKQKLIDKYESKRQSAFLGLGEHINDKVYTEILEDLKQLDEPQLIKLKDVGIDLKDLSEGLRELENRKRLIKAILDGYEIEKKKRYRVKMKGMGKEFMMLKLDKIRDSWYMGNDTEYSYTKTAHTRKELEDADFSWVFDCPGMEVEEVKDDSKV